MANGNAYDDQGRLNPSNIRGKPRPFFGDDPNVELINLMGQGGGDWSDIMNRMLQGWSGRGKHIPKHFQKFAPFIMANLLKTDQARDLMDTTRLTDLAYAPAAAEIQQGAQTAMRDARGAMAQAGLTTSGALPSMTSQIQMQAAGQRGSILNRMLTGQLQQRWAMTRDVGGMAFGFPGGSAGSGSQGTDWSAAAGAAGNALGSYAAYLNQGNQQQRTNSGGGGGSGGGGSNYAA